MVPFQSLIITPQEEEQGQEQQEQQEQQQQEMDPAIELERLSNLFPHRSIQELSIILAQHENNYVFAAGAILEDDEKNEVVDFDDNDEYREDEYCSTRQCNMDERQGESENGAAVVPSFSADDETVDGNRENEEEYSCGFDAPPSPTLTKTSTMDDSTKNEAWEDGSELLIEEEEEEEGGDTSKRSIVEMTKNSLNNWNKVSISLKGILYNQDCDDQPPNEEEEEEEFEFENFQERIKSQEHPHDDDDDEDHQYLLQVKQDSERLCLASIRDHLEHFVSDHPSGTYEEWIESLHPENVRHHSNHHRRCSASAGGDGVMIEIDHRFYIEDSDHRKLWNVHLETGDDDDDDVMSRRMDVPSRSYVLNERGVVNLRE